MVTGSEVNTKNLCRRGAKMLLGQHWFRPGATANIGSYHVPRFQPTRLSQEMQHYDNRIRTSVNGMWFCDISFIQAFIICLRNSWLNGPAYERKPVARRTSPTSRLICASKPLLADVHRIFSPDSPSMSAVAVVILRRQAFASSTRASKR